MAKYKLRNTFSYKEDGTTVDVTVQDVLDTETKIAIPKDEANRHYQEYLEWVAEGNTPDPAD
tara:strand:- start:183 stop:368 length:186 start_codon:yes stop_codon:yes gene_type:complete